MGKNCLCDIGGTLKLVSEKFSISIMHIFFSIVTNIFIIVR